jgi:hypothetical protein
MGEFLGSITGNFSIGSASQVLNVVCTLDLSSSTRTGRCNPALVPKRHSQAGSTYMLSQTCFLRSVLMLSSHILSIFQVAAFQNVSLSKFCMHYLPSPFELLIQPT